MTKADTVQKAWDALGEPEAEAREPEQDPADMEMDELLRVMADGLRRDTGDVILSLYETIRSVAKAGGMEPPGGGNGSPLRHFGLGNPMDRGAWQATVHGVAKS